MSETKVQLEGEALAAEVATMVMGWKKHKGGRSWMSSRSSHAAYVSGFRPDLNIAQAWEVVEEMDREGMFYAITDDFCGAGHRCEFYTASGLRPELRRLGDVVAETAPLAICRAALAAMGASECEP